jgi:hypothetical protein
VLQYLQYLEKARMMRLVNQPDNAYLFQELGELAPRSLLCYCAGVNCALSLKALLQTKIDPPEV